MKIKQRYSGQSLVEFALIFPIVFFLITGFLDLGRAVFYKSSLTNAVREATRYAIVNKNPADSTLQDKVEEYAFGLDRTKITVTFPPKANEFLPTVAIEATYMYTPITPGIIRLFGLNEGISITARSEMLISPGSQ